jgi:acylphosphatase
MPDYDRAGAMEIAWLSTQSGSAFQAAFRAWDFAPGRSSRRQARGVSGWVRNCANGDVEALLSGPSDAVERLLADCRQGPRLAVVATVEVLGSGEACTGAFTIRRDKDN